MKPLFASSYVLPSISYVYPCVSHRAYINPLQHPFIYHLHINKDDLLDKPLFAASCVLPSISYVLPSVSHAAHLNPFQHCGRHPEGRLSSVPVPVSLCLRLSHIRDERKGTRELNTMLLALAFFAFKIFLEQVYTGSQTGFIFLSFRRLS